MKTWRDSSPVACYPLHVPVRLDRQCTCGSQVCNAIVLPTDLAIQVPSACTDVLFCDGSRTSVHSDFKLRQGKEDACQKFLQGGRLDG